jgi:hypothetical protein
MRFKSKSHNRYGKRLKTGQRTKVEILYGDLLQADLLAGSILRWGYQTTTFRLADDLRYTPDFDILRLDGSLLFVDVKGTGPIDDKAIVKIKTAAELFWWFDFVMDIQQPKNLGGGFKRRAF